jgi:hypothetical protein
MVSRYLRRYPSLRRSRWDRKTGLFGSVSALGLPVVRETYARFEKSIALASFAAVVHGGGNRSMLTQQKRESFNYD